MRTGLLILQTDYRSAGTLPPIQTAGPRRPQPHQRMQGTPLSNHSLEPPPNFPAQETRLPSPQAITPPEKETTMIKRHSDLILEITAYDPHTVENDINTAVDMAREHAMQERRHGILVTQHGYTSYTVAVSRDVPFGQTHERRE